MIRTTSAVIATALVMLTSTSAGAGKEYAARALTLERGVLRADIGPADRALLGGLTAGITNNGLVVLDGGDVGLGLGASYGATNALEIGATFVPLDLDSFDYLDPSVYGRYRFTDGNLQIGGQVGVLIPVERSDAVIQVGVPASWRSGNWRTDFAASVDIITTGSTIVDIHLPIAPSLNVTPDCFLGLETGIDIFDSSDVSVPVGVFAGYTLWRDSDRPTDLTISFGLPGNRGQDVNTLDEWVLRFGANVLFE